MEYKKKRALITGSVMASSLIVSLVCIFVLATAGAPAPIPTQKPQETGGAFTPAPTMDPNTTEKPTPYIDPTNNNPTYNNGYTNNEGKRTPSITTAPPTATPYKDAQSLSFNIALKSFHNNKANGEAVYDVTIKMNQTGLLTVIAIDSSRLSQQTIDAQFVRDCTEGKNTALLSKGGSSVYSRQVTANEEHRFDLTTDVEKFTIFYILDPEGGKMEQPIVQRNLGGVPVIESYTAPTIVNGTIKFEVTTSMDTQIRARFKKNGVTVGTDVVKQTTSSRAIFEIPAELHYDGCTVELSVIYNGIAGSYSEPMQGAPLEIVDNLE